MLKLIPLSVIVKGVVKLNLILSPLLLFLFLYIWTVSSRAPGSQGVIASFGISILFVFVLPAAIVLAHVIGAKVFDGFFIRISLTVPGVTVIGLMLSAVLIILAGNIFLDNLYQYRRGNYGISIWALIFDIMGMTAVILAGGGSRNPETPYRSW